MSGARLTRRVTVEGGKKLPDTATVPSSSGGSSSVPAQRRLSVFERLGPGAVDRPKPRESYPVERCRNWMREGRCQFGPNCKFIHGPFTEPAKRTKTVRSVVSKDRSSDKEEGQHHSRTRSVDSLEAAEDDDGHPQPTAPVKKKKHKSGEGTHTKKTSKRQHADKGEEREGEERKRKKKTKKKRDISPVVITKPRSPKGQEGNWPEWGEDEYEAGERGNVSDLEWEEQGELDFQRQLVLEKRRQDLQRQLALMDEEEAALETTDTGVRGVKKDREEQRSVPVVHSRLHPESPSLSPPDEASPASSQSAPKKKKKKVDPDAKRAKHKSPASKERKHKLPRAVVIEPDAWDVSATAKVKSHVPPQEEEDSHLRESRPVEQTAKRIVKSHEKAKEPREGKSGVLRDQNRSPSPVLDTVTLQDPRTPPRSDDVREPTDMPVHGYDEAKNKTDRARRKAAISPPEAHEALSHRDPGGDHVRRSRDGPADTTRRAPREIPETSEEVHKQRRDKVDKARKVTLGEGRGKEDHEEGKHVEEIQPEGRAGRRHVEGGSVMSGPRTPSPEHSATRGPRMPPSPEGPEERHYHAEDLRTSKHGPHTPPGEPSFEDERHTREGRSRGGRSPSRHQRGPRTPPDSDKFLSPTPREALRWTKEGEDFREDHVAFDRDAVHQKSVDHREEPHKVRPGGADDITRERSQAEADPRRRARDTDPHQKTRPHDERPREESRDVEYQRRHDEREDEHQKARPRAEPRDDDHHRRRDERDDGFSRGSAREEREGGYGRGRGRDLPRRQIDGGADRRWDGNRDRDTRHPLDSRGRDRSGERVRERDPRHGAPGPDFHRRPSPPPPPGGRRSPPHGMSRGRGRVGQHRFDERRRSLSPGRRDEGFRGPPRDPTYGRGRDMARGYSGPGDGRGRDMTRGYSGPGDRRPVENRRRASPPQRQFQDRDRGGPRPREPLSGRGRGTRSFPDRPRPPGDRNREGGASWERRPEREHPRDRGRPNDEARDRERKTHGENSPGHGPRHLEEKRGSPVRGPSPPRERRAVHDQERESKERNVDRGRRSADEEDWEYEEGNEKQTRKRLREQPSPVSSSESAVETKKARSLSPDIHVKEEKEGEKSEEKAPETAETTKAAPGKVGKKAKKKKEGKKEAAEVPTSTDDTTTADNTSLLKTETVPAEESTVKNEKNEKKHKKEKGKTKDKGAKKKKKAIVAVPPTEVPEVATKAAETSSDVPFTLEHTSVKSHSPEVELTSIKSTKKRKHGAEANEAKPKEGEKPTKKKKKKKQHQHQQEVVFQPWADLEEREAEERQKIPGEEERESAVREREEQTGEEVKATSQTDKNDHTGEEIERTVAKRVDEVFSDWSDDDSPMGGTTWFNENSPEKAAEELATEQGEGFQAEVAIPYKAPAFDDVYDPISDDELDAMLEEEEADKWMDSAKTPAPMSVEEVDWSALVTSHSSTNKTEGNEPGAHLKRFAPGQVFSRIGISPTLAGPRLTKLVQQACTEAGTAIFDSADSVDSNVLQEAIEETQTHKTAGALVAASAARRRDRQTLFTDVGPCRRALCARRDLAIRKKLRRVSSKFIKLNMFSASPTTPVDSDLFMMSVALYKHERQAEDLKVIPSKVGSVLASSS